MTKFVFGKIILQIKFYQDGFKVLQVIDPILYFFLLMLGIPLDFGPDASHKQSRYSKIWPKEGLKFVPNRGDSIFAFNLSFVLLLAENNLVLEKKGCKKNAFIAHGSGHIKIILISLTKVITLYMQAFIVKVKIPGIEKAIVGYSTYLKLVMFPALNKQF